MYRANHINICSFVCELHDSGTCEVTSFELTLEGCTFIFGVVYRSSICLVDDFISEHIQL